MVKSSHDFFHVSPGNGVAELIEKAMWKEREEEASLRKLFYPALKGNTIYLAGIGKKEIADAVLKYRVLTGANGPRVLDLSHNDLNKCNEITIRKICANLHNNSIESLILRNNGFGKDGSEALRVLFTFLKLTNVKFIDLGFNYLGRMWPDNIISAFSALQETKVEKVNMPYNSLFKLKAMGLFALLDTINRYTNLIHVDISSNDLGKLACPKLAEFDCMQCNIGNLHSVNLSHIGLSYNGLYEIILTWLSSSNVTKLDISASGLWRLQGVELKDVFSKFVKTKVLHLNISENRLAYGKNGEKMEIVLEALHTSSVFHIDFSHNDSQFIKAGYFLDIFRSIPQDKCYKFHFDIKDLQAYAAAAIHRLLIERAANYSCIFDLSFSFDRSDPKSNILFELHKALRYEVLYTLDVITEKQFAKALNYIDIRKVLQVMEDENIFRHYFPCMVHHITLVEFKNFRIRELDKLKENSQLPYKIYLDFFNKFQEEVGDIMHSWSSNHKTKKFVVSKILEFLSYDDMKYVLYNTNEFSAICDQRETDSIMQSSADF